MKEDVRGLRWIDLRICQLNPCSNRLATWQDLRVLLLSHLPANCVTSNSGEAGVPKPAKDFGSCFDSGMLGTSVVGICPFLLVRHGCVPLLSHPNPDEKDVPLLEGDVVLLCNLKDVGKADLMGRERGVSNPLFLSPRRVVN